MASGSAYMTVKIWKISDFSNVKTLTERSDYVRSVAFSHDGFYNDFINQ